MKHLIEVLRQGTNKGVLTYYQDEKEVVKTICWFDPKVRIPAKVYTSCSATYMTRAYAKKPNGDPDFKKVVDDSWRAIFLPDEQTGHVGIFIHRGTGADWSDGCIVISYSELKKVWSNINPKDGRNVVVNVKDK